MNEFEKIKLNNFQKMLKCSNINRINLFISIFHPTENVSGFNLWYNPPHCDLAGLCWLSGLHYPEFQQLKEEGEGEGRGFTCPHLQTVQRLKTEGRNRQKNTVRRKCRKRLKPPDSLTWTTWSGPTRSRFSLSAPGSWIHPRLTQDFSTFTWSRKWEQEEPQQTAAMVSLLWLL